MPSKPKKELPLEKLVKKGRLPDGSEFLYGELKKGYLTKPVLMRLDDEAPFVRLVPPTFNRAELEKVCAQIRAELEAEGWPHDRTRMTPADFAPWRNSIKAVFIQEYDFWLFKIREMTEPLSRIRVLAEALYNFNQILGEFHGDDFDRAYNAMDSWHALKVVTQLNELAVAGAKSKEGRSAGPKARTQNAARRQEKVAALAEQLWKACPHLRERPNITARKLYPDVLRWLEEEYPGSAPVSISTINKDVATYLTKS